MSVIKRREAIRTFKTDGVIVLTLSVEMLTD